MSRVLLPEVELPRFAFHAFTEGLEAKLEGREDAVKLRALPTVLRFIDQALGAFSNEPSDRPPSDHIAAYRILVNGLRGFNNIEYKPDQALKKLADYRALLAKLQDTPFIRTPSAYQEIREYLTYLRTQN